MSIWKKKNEPVVMTVNSSEANQSDLEYISGEAFKALSEMARIYSSVKEPYPSFLLVQCSSCLNYNSITGRNGEITDLFETDSLLLSL